MKSKPKAQRRLAFLVFLLLLALLPLLVIAAQQVQKYLSQASGRLADITIDTSINLGPLPTPWQALAQGGEEKYPFNQISEEIRILKPQYIRLDHIFDAYHVVSKENNQLSFHWEELDQIVDQILKAGAKPLLSLSYMPPAIAQNEQITNSPVNWPDWTAVVRATIQHYSGQENKNLGGMIYEVWNEPDLFGDWKIGRPKDYLWLYRYAVEGANQTQKTNPFKIGGPGTTALYKNWLDQFLEYTVKNQLRLDFYSWHRYDQSPSKFLDDINQVDRWLFENNSHTLPKLITEWGSDSENSPLHDEDFDAAHLVAVSRQLLQRVDLAFIFEIKDGPDPGGKKYWGRWGLLTHESAGPVEKKPRYQALQLLNQMNGNLVSLEGEGTWVSGFATKVQEKTKIILTNLDRKGQHAEVVPLTIQQLANGPYLYQETFLRGPQKRSSENITDNTFKKSVLLTANNVVVIELSPQK